MTWGIGITRIEMDAHYCLTISRRRPELGIVKVQKQFNFLNRTDTSIIKV